MFTMWKLYKLFTLFGLKFNNKIDNNDGLVVKLDPLLQNLKIGDIVKPGEGYSLNKNFGNVVTLVEAPSGHTMIGYANYGSGRVYYLPDTEGQVFSGGEEVFDNIRAVINFRASYMIGKNPENAKDVLVMDRYSTTNTRDISKITLKIWK